MTSTIAWLTQAGLTLAFTWLLQASLALALLYAVYWLFLRRTSFHRLNRFVLLGIALAALGLPLTARFIPDLRSGPHFIADGYVKYTPSAQPIAVMASNGHPLSPAALIAVLITAAYILGVVFFTIRAILHKG